MSCIDVAQSNADWPVAFYLRDELLPITVRRQCDDLELFGMFVYHLERALADRAGRSQEQNAFAGHRLFRTVLSSPKSLVPAVFSPSRSWLDLKWAASAWSELVPRSTEFRGFATKLQSFIARRGTLQSRSACSLGDLTLTGRTVLEIIELELTLTLVAS